MLTAFQEETDCIPGSATDALRSAARCQREREDAMLYEDEYQEAQRALAAQAHDFAERVADAVMIETKIAVTRAARPLRETEARAIAHRTLVSLLYADQPTCAVCHNRIAAVDDAMAIGRFVGDGEDAVTRYELLHLPSRSEAGCYAEATRRRANVTATIFHEPMPVLSASDRVAALALVRHGDDESDASDDARGEMSDGAAA